jgi:ribosomal-protein-alanine N-acetyltransferase
MFILPDRQTERLVLTRPQPSDLADLVRMYSDARVMATLNGVVNAEETERRLGLLLAGWEQHGYSLWIARDRATGEFVGRGGLRCIELEDKLEVEVGYALMSEYWGRGLATELARESIRAAFEELQLPDLVCFTQPTNRASRHVMEKVGFCYERDGTWVNVPQVFYRLTAAQWRAATETP